MTIEDIRLSIVVTSRNDDHGGDFLRRVRIFANGLAMQARRYNLAAELVFVDWNPPEGRPPLSQAVDWDASGPLKFRFIQVSAEIHKRFKNSDTIHLHQMIAKNVGIRRASAPFVLATNVDLLFSDDLIKFFAQSNLDKGCLYRIDRLDVPADIPEVSVDEQLAWCRSNIIRIHTAGGSIIPSGGIYQDQNKKKLMNPYIVHMNASGDFALMSKDAWEKVRGYLELPVFCANLDGLLCLMAIGQGLKEVILKSPMFLYHIDHGLGWAAISFQEQLQLFARRPWLDHSIVNELNDRVARGDIPDIYNDENWGLINEELPEETLN